MVKLIWKTLHDERSGEVVQNVNRTSKVEYRATQLLFDVAKKNAGRSCEFELSMIELYRGESDLLRGKNERAGAASSYQKDHTEQITSRMQQELKSALLETWSVWLTVGKRHTASTLMNASRPVAI